MKNVCVVLQEHVNIARNEGLQAVVDEFYLGGYIFEEIRFLSVVDIGKLKKNLASLKIEYENVCFVAENKLLAFVKGVLTEELPTAKIYAEFGDALIFDDKNSTVFLVSQDKTELGVQYVRKACIPFLQKKYGLLFDKIVIRSVGTSETLVKNLLAETNRRAGNKLFCKHERKNDEEVIEIIYNSNTPKMLADDVLRILADGLGDTMYALENVTLEEQLVALLKVRGKKISVAESFTGGGVAKRIVSVSGASEVYFEGLNTYDERSKIKRLGVSAYTLGSFGAVSEKTAYEMALGLLDTGDCDIAVATTGLAGPKSDKSGLPVGYCCIAVGTKERISVYQYRFDGSREEITEKAINYALFLAYKHLKNV